MIKKPSSDFFFNSSLEHLSESKALVHDVIEQLVPSVEQHYQALIRRFIRTVSSENMRDDAIHGGPTLASCVDGFLG